MRPRRSNQSHHLARTMAGGTAMTVAAAAVILTGVAWAGSFSATVPAAGPSTVPSAEGGAVIPNSYIVILDDAVPASGVDGMAHRLAAGVGGEVGRTWVAGIRGFEVTASAAAARRLRSTPKVAFVEPNQVMHTLDTQDDPPSFGLDRIDERSNTLDKKFTFPSSASEVHAYIIDTGIRASHKDFDGRVESGFSVEGDDADDCNGHGTHVAGTVGGSTFGVAKEVKLVAVRVLDCNGAGSTGDIITGVNFVTKNAIKPAVANMSVGGRKSAAIDRAVAASIASGVTYTVAAGNNNVDACAISPAAVPTAITVGATDRQDKRAVFSNFGSCVDIFAPGVRITSDFNGSDSAKKTISGTSMSCPHVTGAAAIVLATHPDFSPEEIQAFLIDNATTGAAAALGEDSPDRLLFIVQ